MAKNNHKAKRKRVFYFISLILSLFLALYIFFDPCLSGTSSNTDLAIRGFGAILATWICAVVFASLLDALQKRENKKRWQQRKKESEERARLLQIRKMQEDRSARIQTDELNEKVDQQLPYRRKKSILTDCELKFYERLCEAYSDTEYVITCKPSLKEFTETRKPASENRFFKIAHNKISQKHVDFLLCKRQNMKPYCVFECDDSSHFFDERTIQSDTFKNALFDKLNLPIIRIKTTDDWFWQAEENLNELLEEMRLAKWKEQKEGCSK